MSTFRAWIAATRPKTLVAAVAPIALGGAVVVAYAGASGLWADQVFVLTLLSCLGFALCVQVACNVATGPRPPMTTFTGGNNKKGPVSLDLRDEGKPCLRFAALFGVAPRYAPAASAEH